MNQSMMRSAALVGLLVLASGCGGPSAPWCGPETCNGCCNGEICEGGTEPSACGTAGAACLNCATCSAGTCGAGGGAGGGSGVGGGAGGGAGGGGGLVCAAPLIACGTACVDPRSDANHCGSCATVCTSGCSAGQCSILPADCTEQPCPSLGYYCDLSSNQCKAGCVLDTQCSGPLNTCDTTSRTCGCKAGSCGASSYCTAARACAAGCEQNSQCSGQNNTCHLPSHTCVCSANSCPAGNFCGSDGACKVGCGSNAQCAGPNENTCNLVTHACECNPGFHKCGGVCVSNTSINSCGASCTPCAAPPAHATATCTASACSFECAPSHFRVGASCYPKQALAATFDVGNEITCSVNELSGLTQCNTFIQSGTPDLVYLAASYDILCALSSTGTVYCAGRSNYNGDLGVGLTPSYSPTFLPLPNLPTNVVKIGHNDSRGFALTATGDVWRWGDGWQTNTGSNPWAINPSPTPSMFRSGVKDMSVARDYLCVITTSSPDQIACSGGYSGSNGSYSTKYVNAPSGAVLEKVSYAADHGCAIDSLGAVYCWGRASGGKLGYSTTSIADQPLTAVPNFPPPGTKAIAVAVTSYQNSCALLDTGKLYCWGQLGTANVATPTPTAVRPTFTFTNLAANWQRICPSGATGCFRP